MRPETSSFLGDFASLVAMLTKSPFNTTRKKSFIKQKNNVLLPANLNSAFMESNICRKEMSMASKEGLNGRDLSLDIAKGILILLVVIGHSLEKFGGIPSRIYLHNAIFIFHMPMFIAISGYLSKQKEPKKFWMQQLAILETYLVFQALQFFPGAQLTAKSIWHFISYSEWTLWYLPCLILWRIATQYYGHIFLKKPVFYFSGAVVLSLFWGYFPFQTSFNIQRLVAFFPFFLGGFLYRNYPTKDIVQKSRLFCLLSGIILLPWLILHTDGVNWNHLFSNSYNYYQVHELLFGPFIRLGQFICAVAMTILVLRLSKRIRSNKILEWAGKNSLLIYMFHTPIIIFLSSFLHFRNTWLALAFALGILVVIYGLSFLNQSILLNPISTLFQYIRRISNGGR